MPIVFVRTPLRVSFFGGGTDLPAFYERSPGRVLSAAIDKHTYVMLKSRYDTDVYANWMQKEIVAETSLLRHELIREALTRHGIRNSVEVNTLSDIPSGSGLASSSSITVGLLLASSTYQGCGMSALELARDACRIEIEVLNKSIGRQDQYICALGGVRQFTFNADHSVDVESLAVPPATLVALEEHLMLFFTGTTREADPILREIGGSIDANMLGLSRLSEMVIEGVTALHQEDWRSFGTLLDEAWRRKRGLANSVSNARIDEIYESARQAGALGGKIAGAGGGGFLLLFVEPGRRAAVRSALNGLHEIRVGLAKHGSHVVYFDDAG